MYFQDTSKGVLHFCWLFQGMNNRPKIIKPTIFMEHLNEGLLFRLGFVRVTQYLSKFQKIWFETQIIFGIFRKWYYTFIEYFALWTWIQHALNASKLNWNFVLLWLSTWFVIPPLWKIVSKQNLQYLYIGCQIF